MNKKNATKLIQQFKFHLNNEHFGIQAIKSFVMKKSFWSSGALNDCRIEIKKYKNSR